MPILDSIADFFAGLFGGHDDEGADLEEEDEVTLDGVDPEDYDYEDMAESDYIVDYADGEYTGLPAVDRETGIEYCSGAPEGILVMVLANPVGVYDGEEPEYEIYRNESG